MNRYEPTSVTPNTQSGDERIIVGPGGIWPVVPFWWGPTWGPRPRPQFGPRPRPRPHYGPRPGGRPGWRDEGPRPITPKRYFVGSDGISREI